MLDTRSQELTEVELRCIFDVYKRWANSGSHEFVKKNMVRYMRPHGRFAHCSCKNAAHTVNLGLSASAAGWCCIFTLAVRQPPVLASCIEMYYFYGHSGGFRHTCLCFYYACGNIRHTEYRNNSHTIVFHTVL